jgi:hypothetical protein
MAEQESSQSTSEEAKPSGSEQPPGKPGDLKALIIDAVFTLIGGLIRMRWLMAQVRISCAEKAIRENHEIPRVTEALRKLKEIEDDKTDLGIQRHVKFLAAVKKLLSRDTSMTHDEATCRVFRENPELWPTK